MSTHDQANHVVLMASKDNEESVRKLNEALNAHTKDGMTIESEIVEGDTVYIRLHRPFESVAI